MASNTGGPRRIAGKPGLITGTEFRTCPKCGAKRFVPHHQPKGQDCDPCKRGFNGRR